MAGYSPGISFDEAAFLDAFGSDTDHLRPLLKQFSAVRYIAVASLTLVLFDRISSNNAPHDDGQRSRSRGKCGWAVSASVSLAKLFYRFLLLFSLALDVVIFTQDLSDCAWWFSFRAWFTLVLSTIVQLVILAHLSSTFFSNDRRWRISSAVAGSTLILAHLVSNAAFTASNLRHHLSFPANPGPWFSGCFPASGANLLHVWISSIALTALFSLAALLGTLRQQRSTSTPFIKAAWSNGTAFYLGILGGMIFCGTWWAAGPKPTIGIAPTLSSVVWACFGGRILESTFTSPPSPSPSPLEDEESRPTTSEKRGGPSSLDLSPQSQAPTLPVTTMLPPCSPSTSSDDDVKNTTIVPLPLPLTVNTNTGKQVPTMMVQLARPLSETTLHNTIVEEEGVAHLQHSHEHEHDHDSDLSDVEEEKDRPKRTHERKWKSDELPHLVPPEVPLATRPRSLYDSFDSGFFDRPPPTEGMVPMTMTTITHPPTFLPALSPLSPSPSPSPSPSKRRSVSSFFHRPPAVPEHEAYSHSYTPSPSSGDADFFPEPKRKRVRRFLSGSGSSIRSKRSSRSKMMASAARRDSDAMTICTVSTTFAFDNAGARDAPDFTN